MTPAADLNREDAIYLAGVLEGEGCFDSPRGAPRVRIKMTDLDVVLRCADIMGASTYSEIDSRAEHYKPLMVAQLTGDRAVALMRAVLPWMGSRRSARITDIVTAHAARKDGRIRLLRVQRSAA